tara:strand:- start:17741 stop:18844 length:1104 start_codon:yes stop_codon:yes gene_type:complete
MKEYNIKEPLVDYPWKMEAIRILKWLKEQPKEYRSFVFDLCMSLAYIDSTSGLERHLQSCPSCPSGFDSHIGFINLCSPCYEKNGTWQYQKATKPQSGALGKLSSEMILKFVEILFDEFTEVYSIGGTETADARLVHKDGKTILAEVKSAPLLTFPLLVKSHQANDKHSPCTLTSSQFRELESAIYMHNGEIIPLGTVKSDNWPFKPVADFLTNYANKERIINMLNIWNKARLAYENKDRNSSYYYLANASGGPPKIAKERDGWPQKESISDSKTSAGMDRTDDIKKGIYQVMKLGVINQDNPNIETAIISNLPAYRHRKDYVDPFIKLLWGTESNLEKNDDFEYIKRDNLKYIFDHLITLDSPILR